MWTVADQPFVNAQERIVRARDALGQALVERRLTIVVGNGPTRSATMLHSRSAATPQQDTGWEAVVRRLAVEAGIDERLSSSGSNLLALAQAIISRLGSQQGQRLLTEGFRGEFRRSIPGTLIHSVIAHLSPRYLLTTNYDLQIERCLEEAGREWVALVRDVSPEHAAPTLAPDQTVVLKMHGTVAPDPGLESRYVYADTRWQLRPEDSIVIAESDYMDCLYELHEHKADQSKSLILEALSAPTLILGKSMAWQDLSFLYALRAASGARAASPAYTIVPSLTLDEELNLQIRTVDPLRLNMPSNPNRRTSLCGAHKGTRHLTLSLFLRR